MRRNHVHGTCQLVPDPKGQHWALCPVGPAAALPAGRQAAMAPRAGLRLLPSPHDDPQLALVMTCLGSPGGGGRSHAPHTAASEPASPQRAAAPLQTQMPTSAPGRALSRLCIMASVPESLWGGPGFGGEEPGPRPPHGDTTALASASRGREGSFFRMRRVGQWEARQLPQSWGKQAGGPRDLRGLRTAPARPTEGAPAHHRLSARLLPPAPPPTQPS